MSGLCAAVLLAVDDLLKVLRHFRERWPVFRPKIRQRKDAGAVSISSDCEIAPGKTAPQERCFRLLSAASGAVGNSINQM